MCIFTIIVIVCNKQCHIDLFLILFFLCFLMISVSGRSNLNTRAPVVLSIVSLTSSLSGQLVKCFKTL